MIKPWRRVMNQLEYTLCSSPQDCRGGSPQTRWLQAAFINILIVLKAWSSNSSCDRSPLPCEALQRICPVFINLPMVADIPWCPSVASWPTFFCVCLHLCLSMSGFQGSNLVFIPSNRSSFSVSSQFAKTPWWCLSLECTPQPQV